MKNSPHLTSPHGRHNHAYVGFKHICILLIINLIWLPQLQAQCDCDPILMAGDTVVDEALITDAIPWTTTITGLSYHITTDLTINTNFTLTGGARFSMDPGVSIIVMPGVTLTVTNGSILTAADNTMWAGIKVQASTLAPGKVYVNNGATIANAETGIFLNNLYTQYAECRVTADAFFCNNHIGILSNRYDGMQPSLIAESEFCANNLLDPYLGDFGTGVRIEDNYATGALFTVGNALAYSPATCNTFHDMHMGVDAYRSHTLVQNNFFYDMVVPGSLRGTGIYGQSDYNYLTVVLTAGNAAITAGNDANRFRDCERGIELEDYYNSSLHRNRFTNTAMGSTSTMKEGILIQNCGLGINHHTITYNDIFNVDLRSIDMRGNNEASIQIKGNNILSSMTIPTAIIRRGISVLNVPPSTALVDIDSNRIENMRNGIATFNYTENLKIRGNTISVTYPGTGEPAKGILADNCSNVLIDLYDPSGTAVPNMITGTCTSGCDDNMIGIDIQSSTDFLCYRNIVNDCYPGIRAEGDCYGGNFVCNDLDNCTTGFGLKNLGGDISLFISTINLGVGVDREIFGGYYGVTGMIPSDNAWTPSSGSTSTWANRTNAYGDVDPTIGEDLNWYYLDAFSELDMEPATTLNTQSGIGSLAIPTASLINTPGFDIDIHPRCSFPMPRLEEEEEEGGEMLLETGDGYADTDSLYYSKMISDYAEKLTSGALDDPFQHLNEMSAYRLLKMYPDVEWESEATATVSSWLEGSNTTAFFTAMYAINTADVATSWSILETVSPVSMAEEQYLFVLVTYLNCLDSNGRFTLLDAYREDIENIAIQHTLVGGEAVHIARAMLDTVIEFDGDIYEVLRTQPKALSKLKVYPIPANYAITIENIPVEQGSLQIYDIFGRQVYSNQFKANNKAYTLQVDLLKPGVYNLIIINQQGKQVERVYFSKL